MVLNKILKNVLHEYFENLKLFKNYFRPLTFIKSWVVNCRGLFYVKAGHCSAFVAVDFIEKAIVLAYRGTDTKWQLAHEAISLLFEDKVPSVFGYGNVAFYFDDIFNQLDSLNVTEVIYNLIRIYPNYDLWITGHSLGGALASLAAAKIVHSRKIPQERIKLMTFGQPRTGDSGFAYEMEKELSFYNYRVVRGKDVIVHVPHEDYAHYSTEIFYDNDMKEASQWKYCYGGDKNMSCSKKYDFEMPTYPLCISTKLFIPAKFN
uniref:Fungal lipase-like domain-containing protein n=1 Tax=Meloidogyne incognita TaxID=6306 RepID=A0A914N337_MELIC